MTPFEKSNLQWVHEAWKPAFTTPLFSIDSTRSTCLRTSQNGTFYRFNFADWVTILAITEKKELVMVQEYRHGSDSIELGLPGGCIEPHENPLHSATRELLEETGFKGLNGTLLGSFLPNPPTQGNRAYVVFFEHSQKKESPKMEDLESIHTLLIPLKQINSDIQSGKIRHGIVISALYYLHLTRPDLF